MSRYLRHRVAAKATLWLLLLALGGCGGESEPDAQPAPSPSVNSGAVAVAPPTHVGAAACAGCHREQHEAWKGSHHALAMQVADEATVLGDFRDASLEHAGMRSRFFRRDGKFMVATEGADGTPADFEVSHAFGVWPLQQYLVPFPGGRFQALNLAWDSRARSEGGQRWFDLQAGDKPPAGSALHWTGRYQNWALQCAECHSTRLRKNYDAATDSYRTTYSEINVACEACHGPGSRHVERMRDKAPASDNGLVVDLKSDWQAAWRFSPDDTRIARRAQRAPDAAMNTCAACHARRSTLSEEGTPGAALADTHRPALPMPPLYHADGQQRDEVYVWASFAQSAMAAAGVTCMDCHDAHTSKLHGEGNALCARCHNPAVFDRAQHHHHVAGSAGTQCVACHMPEQDYMLIDARRDHSIRVPRPDLSDALGTPNACTQCHDDRKASWAAAALDRWQPDRRWRERPEYGSTLHAAQADGAKAVLKLLPLARDPRAPGIVRATAAALAAGAMRPALLPNVDPLLLDADPLVRMSALGLLETLPPELRVRAAAQLSDPIRGVRTEAARIMADVPDAALSAEARAARAAALAEYSGALALNADWPPAQASLGDLYLKQGRHADARAAYERALELDPLFVGAYVNLADLHRAQGNEAEGERVLADALARVPDSADLHHALGLAQVRRGDAQAALGHLATAARLAPDNARYAYVHAIALDSHGGRAQALEALRAADARHPYDIGILGALVAMQREGGAHADALRAARKLAEALPEDAGVRQVVAELEAASRQ